MTDKTDPAEAFDEYGILLQLWSMVLEPDEGFPIRSKVIYALGGITCTKKEEPINNLLGDGIIDNLFKACESEDEESLSKILWVCSNISSSSSSAANTVSQSELFQYALDSLWKDEIQNMNVKTEALHLAIHTFDLLPSEARVDLIRDSVGEDSNGFLTVLVEGISMNYSTTITKYCLECIYQIFKVAQVTPSWPGEATLLEEVLDEFCSAGGPETIDHYTGDENQDISRFASNIEVEFLGDTMDQVHDAVDFSNDTHNMDFS